MSILPLLPATGTALGHPQRFTLAHIITAEYDDDNLNGMTLGPTIPNTARSRQATQVPGLTAQQQQQELLEKLMEFKDVFSDVPSTQCLL